MLGLTLRSRPFKVNEKVHSVRAVKAYVKKPKCLRCGYNLRGQYMAGLNHCSECGQACDFQSIADQISGQAVGKVPVIREVRAGVIVMLGYPIFAVVTTLVIANLIQLFLTGPAAQISLWVLLATHALIYIGLIIHSLLSAYRAMGDYRGIVFWLATYVYSLVIVACLITLLLSAVVMVVMGYEYLLGDGRNQFRPPDGYYFGGCLLAFLVALLVVWLNELWSRYLIIRPCRRRCRAYVLEMLEKVVSVPHMSAPGAGPAEPGD